MINQNNLGITAAKSMNYEINQEDNSVLHNIEHSEHSIYVEMPIYLNLFFLHEKNIFVKEKNQ